MTLALLSAISKRVTESFSKHLNARVREPRRAQSHGWSTAVLSVPTPPGRRRVNRATSREVACRGCKRRARHTVSRGEKRATPHAVLRWGLPWTARHQASGVVARVSKHAALSIAGNDRCALGTRPARRRPDYESHAGDSRGTFGMWPSGVGDTSHAVRCTTQWTAAVCGAQSYTGHARGAYDTCHADTPPV